MSEELAGFVAQLVVHPHNCSLHCPCWQLWDIQDVRKLVRRTAQRLNQAEKNAWRKRRNLELQRRWHARRLGYVPPEERQPLLEDLSHEPSWCRLCWLKTKLLEPHLRAAHRDELSATGEGSTLTEYRRLLGYSKTTALISADVADRLRRTIKTTNSRRLHQGKRPVGAKARFKKRNSNQKALQFQADWGVSKEARQRMSIAGINRAKPQLRRKSPRTGKPVTDWDLAQLRLQGKTLDDMERKYQLDGAGLHARLQRIGLPPGRACLFYRGEPITEKHLQAHCEDLKDLRIWRPVLFRSTTVQKPLNVTELAALLRVPKYWVRQHTNGRCSDPIPHSHGDWRRNMTFQWQEVKAWLQSSECGRHYFKMRKVIYSELAKRLGVSLKRVGYYVYWRKAGSKKFSPYPLSLRVARALLSSINSLREEFRRGKGSSAKGGRPKALLPSEEKELLGKYQALKADIDLMLSWAERERAVITMDMVGEWMCQQSRLRKTALLFWPSIHARLPEICEDARNRMRGRFGSAERAKEILCEEYGISRAQLHRAIFTTASPVLATP